VLFAVFVTVVAAKPLYAEGIEDRFHVLRTPFSEIQSELGWYERGTLSRAMVRRPDLDACIATASSGEDLELNWSELHHQSDLMICAFLAAEAMNTPDDFADWLAGQGFDVYTTSYTYDFQTREQALIVFAGCSPRSDCPLRVLSLRHLTARLMERRMKVAIFYDAESQPVSTQFSINWQ